MSPSSEARAATGQEEYMLETQAPGTSTVSHVVTAVAASAFGAFMRELFRLGRRRRAGLPPEPSEMEQVRKQIHALAKEMRDGFSRMEGLAKGFDARIGDIEDQIQRARAAAGD